ncbi:MAG: signal peptidase I [Thermodesulfovibrionales bacterium]
MKKNKKRVIWEYAEAIVTALLLALFIRAFVVQAFKIPTGSMEPTLLVGDHILVNKFIYGIRVPFSDRKVFALSRPERGDIVVFKFPEDPERDFIKRIVAVGGDVIEERDKVLYVNGEPVVEPYARHTDRDVRPPGMDPRDNFGPVVVPEGKYFMMGDNRDQSYDSRFWGFVDASAIKGEALIIYWSWNGKDHMPRLGRLGHLVE